jgi:hypothetical protein
VCPNPIALRTQLLLLLVVWSPIVLSFPVHAASAGTLLPSCSESFQSLVGQRIDLTQNGTLQIDGGYSYVMHGWGLDRWSSRSNTVRQDFLSITSQYVTLSIDGRPTPLDLTICYDKDGSWSENKDSVWKEYWVQFKPSELNGTHVLTGKWYGDTAPGLLSGVGTVIVTFGNHAARIGDATVIPDPDHVGQGSIMIFNVAVDNIGIEDMSSAKVQLNTYRPDGRLTASASKDITSFKTGTERTVQLTYNLPSSALPGTWTYDVSVYYAKTLLDETTRPFTVEPPSITGRIVSVAFNPNPMVRGGTGTITVNVKNTGNMVWSTAKITVKIYRPDGRLYGTYNIVVKNLPPNVESNYSTEVQIISNAPSGTYGSGVSLTYGASQVDFYKGTVQVV